MTHLRAIPTLLLLAASSLSCSLEPEPVPFVCRRPEVGIAALGTWSEGNGFVPFARGDALQIAFSANGIYLFYVSVAVTGFERPSPDPSPSPVRIGMRWPSAGSSSPDEVELVGGASDDVYADIQNGVAVFHGIPGQLTWPDVKELFDQSVRLEAEVTDGCGRVIETNGTVALRF